MSLQSNKIKMMAPYVSVIQGVDTFDKLVEIGIPEAQLYKMAGNSVTTNVVTAIGLKLIQEIQKLEVI